MGDGWGGVGWGDGQAHRMLVMALPSPTSRNGRRRTVWFLSTQHAQSVHSQPPVGGTLTVEFTL